MCVKEHVCVCVCASVTRCNAIKCSRFSHFENKWAALYNTMCHPLRVMASGS